MNRTEALAYLNSTMDVVMTAAGRLLTDTLTGYKPALDRAFRIYIGQNSLGTTITTTDTDDDDDECFTALLEATVYDLALPAISNLKVDVSVDAPLSNIKFSQAFRQFNTLRNNAWLRASACGYGLVTDNTNAFSVNLDFLEPATGINGEWSS